MVLNRKTSISLFTIISLLSCSTKQQPDINWNYDKSEITGNAHTNTEKLSVDIYLDVTTSMKGFVSQSVTDFTKLLDDVEATCQNVWKNTDIQFYKFGRSVVPISRSEFVSGKTSHTLYSDAKLSTQTNFDEAVKKTNYKRVSILITDFFYNNNDVNLVVNSIKTYCFQKGVEAGLIGLNSPFQGIVADVQPPVSVRGLRPLYVLVFGDKQNINLLLNTFKNKNYIKPDQLLLITAKPTESYDVSVIKDKKCRTINKQSLKKELQDFGTVFNFRMKEAEKSAQFNAEITLHPNPYVSTVTEKNLKPLVYKKFENSKDSVAVYNELTLQNVKFTGNTIKADINLENNDKAGKFSYAVYLTLDNTIPPEMPKWVKQVSTETYAQGVNENKTLNLEKLLTGISVNHITFAQPKLAKFYINIEKR